MTDHQAWPRPLGEDAYYGLVGEVVRTVEPHTEADPAAVLVQALVAFGNVIGRGAGFKAEADFHATNLYALIVGETSKGRKGTSFGYVRRLIAEADSEYVEQRLEGGLSSGEGLVWAVRDSTTRKVAPDEKSREVRSRAEADPGGEDAEADLDRADGAEWVEEIVDPGVEDKRLLVVEAEFSQALKVMARPGNTLSAVVRSLWDHGSAGMLTKNSPAKCSDGHVSIIGHIVRDELRRELTGSELLNGFANRFLFVCARRSKLLPDGGRLDNGDLGMLAFLLADAVAKARDLGVSEPLGRDPDAGDLWREVYAELSEGTPGQLGAATSRAEAQVMRIAVLYAVLDGRRQVNVAHLRAALEVWRYCEDSARYIFGDALGDPVADEILAALRSRGPAGMTRTDIRDLFHRHRRGDQVGVALDALAAAGKARLDRVPTGGRSVERWFAVDCDRSDESDKSGSPRVA